MSDLETRDSQLVDLLKLHRDELNIYFTSQTLFLEALLTNVQWEEELTGSAREDVDMFTNSLKELIKNVRELSKLACQVASSVYLSKKLTQKKGENHYEPRTN